NGSKVVKNRAILHLLDSFLTNQAQLFNRNVFFFFNPPNSPGITITFVTNGNIGFPLFGKKRNAQSPQDRNNAGKVWSQPF
ncbi:MAG: hypothetical protein RI556_12090, partial [Hydrogenovibrio sp.]|uniref:hypothetical protein n=1 Tax=Hydrogenovibrio sp. TaxID=2065821 RepID=UPI00286FED9C